MGSRPSAPVTYRPTPTAPTIYQSVIPEADFKLARDYVDELKTEREKKRKRLEDAGFAPSDIATRQKSYMKSEEDMYKASLPKTSLGSSGSAGTTP